MDGDGGLIVYGTPIGTSAYEVDTEEIERRADEIDRVAGRLEAVIATLRRALGHLAPRAHLAAGGWMVVAQLEEACARIGALRREAAKIASSARIAAARYEWAEAAARARIPGPGIFGFRGPAVPLLVGPMKYFSDLLHRRELDHVWWAQGFRTLPRTIRVDPRLWLPGPFFALGMGAGLGEAVARGMISGFRMGQWHPGGAGVGKILREATHLGYPGDPDPTTQAARALAFGFGPWTGVQVREVAPPPGARSGPASNVAEVLAAIGPLYPDEGAAPGGFRIDRLTAPDGSVAWQVFVPGSQGGLDSRNPLSWCNNPGAFIGMETASSRMIIRAMREAGVGPTDPVVIAGHSQGGMVAVNVANHPEVREEFNIEGVITAGSPISNLAVPDGRTLALEHTEDPVPGLDDASNSLAPGMITVERPLHASSDPLDQAVTNATGSHDLPAYLRTAERVDAAEDPRLAGVKDLLEEMAPDGVAVESRYFQGIKPPGVVLPGPVSGVVCGGPAGGR